MLVFVGPMIFLVILSFCQLCQRLKDQREDYEKSLISPVELGKKTANLEKIIINWQDTFSYAEFCGEFESKPCQFVSLGEKRLETVFWRDVVLQKMENWTI